MTYPQIRQPARFGLGPDDFRKQIERAIGGRVESGGALSLAVTAVTSDTTIGSDGYFFPVDASGGAVTMTLPPAALSAGRIVAIKKTDSSGYAVTIDGNASETIDDATTATISVQYVTLELFCDGTEWWII